MSVAHLLDLSDLCERGRGADRELDVRIWHGVSPGLGVPWEKFSRGMEFEKNNWCPHYTASIDAALKLLDPRTLWAVGDMEEGAFARICRPMPCGGYAGGYLESNATSAERSLCAVALRAIAASTIEARSAETTEIGSAEGESVIGDLVVEGSETPTTPPQANNQ